MAPRPPGSCPPRLRCGLVIGAGAAVGGAWAAGAVCALTETGAFDPAGPELVVGTSAGSVVAALLAAGMPPRELAGLFSDDRESGTPPVRPELSARVRATLRDVPRPVPIPGNLRLAARTLGRPGHRALRTAAAALAPRGRGDLAPVGELVGAVQGDRTWPARPRTWLVAMDFDSGRRVAFGAPGEPPTSPAEAVMASCSVPGLFAPRFIAGRRYVDGGAVSVTNADVLAGEALDEVVVVAPLVTPGPLPRRSAAARIEHRVRLHIAQRLSWEVWRLLAAGMSVRVLTPTAEDVAAMGVDRMDAGRHRRVFETAVRTTTAQLAAEAPPAAAHAEIDGVA